MAQKPRLLIALPSICYGPVVARTLNTFGLAESLRPFFDITLAYHRIDTSRDVGFPTLSIVPELDNPGARRSAYAAMGHPWTAARYMATIHNFAKQYAESFDAVLERQWQFVGALSHAFSGPERVVAVTLEGEYYGDFAARKPVLAKRAIRAGKRQLLFHLRRFWMDRVDFALMETEEARRAMIGRGLIGADKTYELMPMGVNPEVFYPQEQKAARRQLKLDENTTILTYVGSLNRWTQEPGPLIEAFCRHAPDNVRLHIVGDGLGRDDLRKLAGPAGTRIVFYGNCAQPDVAKHIAAADLCVAPYNIDRFLDRRFTSASLKIVEYLACARPVLTIPSAQTARLTAYGRHGFMVENTTEGMVSFLCQMPQREELATMRNVLESDLVNGVLRREGKALSWSDIAGSVASAYMKAAAQKRLDASAQAVWARPVI